jgi:hypothetical protein
VPVEAVNLGCYRFEARASGLLGFWRFHLGIKFTIFLPVFLIKFAAFFGDAQIHFQVFVELTD